MSEALGEALFLSCRKHGVAFSPLRGWNRTESIQGNWKCVSEGLAPSEKAKWVSAAKMFLGILKEADYK